MANTIKVYGFTITGEGKYDNIHYANFAGQFYLHGKLEDMNYYDLCGLNVIPEEGIHDCEVYLHNGEAYKATLFCWVNRKVGRPRGLIVLDSDTTYYEDAKEKYEKKVLNF